MIRAGGAAVSTPPAQGGDGGANPTPALQPRDLLLCEILPRVAADLIVRRHYLHAMCAGTRLCLGVFAGGRLLGTIALNAGPIAAPKLVGGATTHDTLTLARLWLADELSANSESRVLGLLVRLLRRHTAVRFLVSYADPAAGHVGTVYQAAGWLNTGTSEAQPLMSLDGGPPRHTRSIASVAGTHSAAFFRQQGMAVELVPTIPKHRYLVFVDPTWRDRLRAPVLPYPKKEAEPDGSARRSD